MVSMVEFIRAGALTSKVSAFRARSWELEKVYSVDVLDSFGAAICVHSRGSRVIRVLPGMVENGSIQDEWISDRVRFSYDAYSRQRLVVPLIRFQNLLLPLSWFYAFRTFFQQLNKRSRGSSTKSRLLGFVGKTVGLKTAAAFHYLISRLGGQVAGFGWPTAGGNFVGRGGFSPRLGRNELDNYGFCLLAGVNLRLENPLVDVWLRRRVRYHGLKVSALSPSTVGLQSAGVSQPVFDGSAFGLVRLFQGRSWLNLSLAKLPSIVLVGHGLVRSLGPRFLNLWALVSDRFVLLSPFMGQSTSLELGFQEPVWSSWYVPHLRTISYLLYADEVFIPKSSTSFIVYQGSAGDRAVTGGESRWAGKGADLVFPGHGVLEWVDFYVNLFGQPVRTASLGLAPSGSREDSTILLALGVFSQISLAGFSTTTIPYSDFTGDLLELVRERSGWDLNLFSSWFFLPPLDFSGTVPLAAVRFWVNRPGRIVFDYLRVDSFTRSSVFTALTSRRFFDVSHGVYRNLFKLF